MSWIVIYWRRPVHPNIPKLFTTFAHNSIKRHEIGYIVEEKRGTPLCVSLCHRHSGWIEGKSRGNCTAESLLLLNLRIKKRSIIISRRLLRSKEYIAQSALLLNNIRGIYSVEAGASHSTRMNNISFKWNRSVGYCFLLFVLRNKCRHPCWIKRRFILKGRGRNLNSKRLNKSSVTAWSFIWIRVFVGSRRAGQIALYPLWTVTTFQGRFFFLLLLSV